MVSGRRRIFKVVGDVRITRCQRAVLDVFHAETMVMDRMRSVQDAYHVLFPMKSRRMAAGATVTRASIMQDIALVTDVLRARYLIGKPNTGHARNVHRETVQDLRTAVHVVTADFVLIGG